MQLTVNVHPELDPESQLALPYVLQASQLDSGTTTLYITQDNSYPGICIFIKREQYVSFLTELIKAAGYFETLITTIDSYSPAELAPAGVSEQDEEVPF